MPVGKDLAILSGRYITLRRDHGTHHILRYCVSPHLPIRTKATSLRPSHRLSQTRRTAPLAILTAAVLALTPPLTAQSLTSGTISGTIQTPDARPVPQALVTLIARTTQEATTTAAGSFRIHLVQPSSYEILIPILRRDFLAWVTESGVRSARTASAFKRRPDHPTSCQPSIPDTILDKLTTSASLTHECVGSVIRASARRSLPSKGRGLPKISGTACCSLYNATGYPAATPR